MNRLPETQQAISQLAANRPLMFGMHDNDQLKIGVPGHVVAEIPFDPALHDPSAINPLSIWEDILGEPHVQQVIPSNPLAVNIVVHREGRDVSKETAGRKGSQPSSELQQELIVPVSDAKMQLASELREALLGARVPGDKIRSYFVGAPMTAGEAGGSYKAETEEPEAASQAIAELCLKGLTFVISDFNRLRLRETGANKHGLVAVKVNHRLERELPSGVGVIAVGGLREVNTNRAARLEAANNDLAAKHTEIVRRLGQAGAQVASLMVGGREPGLDFLATDQALAQAVEQI